MLNQDRNQPQSVPVSVHLLADDSHLEASLFLINGDQAVLRSAVEIPAGTSAIIRRHLNQNNREVPVEVGEAIESEGLDHLVEVRLRALGSVADRIWQAFCYAA